MANNFKAASFTVGSSSTTGMIYHTTVNGAWQSNPFQVTTNTSVGSTVTWTYWPSAGDVGIMTPVNPGEKAWRDMFKEIRALEAKKKEA